MDKKVKFWGPTSRPPSWILRNKGSFSDLITEPPTSDRAGEASDTPLAGGRGVPSDLDPPRSKSISRLEFTTVEEVLHSILDLDIDLKARG